ncbi:hypothetical protein EHW64_19440 [Erwinia psidii]|uniref:NUMOD4 domain-containing protein n=1 Tax=Erwinia psidii TaxID=69224 RepID=UPI0039799F0F|nr:hypothetical protein [Erwinia psidii]
MPEIWKPIPGFEDRYEVSNQGHVRSIPRLVRAVSKAGNEYFRRVPGVVLSPGSCRGYLIVNIPPKGSVKVHQLVALAFVEGYQTGLEVNHIDGTKANNNADNLEWVSRSANQFHAVSSGLKSQAIAVRNPDTGQLFPSISQAAKVCHVNHRTAAKWKIESSGSISKLSPKYQ